jgi:hypothetical protein
MTDLAMLAVSWAKAKEAEQSAANERRRIEDAMSVILDVPDDLDSTMTHPLQGCEIKVSGRINRAVDSDLLQKLAAKYGCSDQLPILFRWKPELNMRLWREADNEIKTQLSKAITTKPGRPNFSINFNSEI